VHAAVLSVVRDLTTAPLARVTGRLSPLSLRPVFCGQKQSRRVTRPSLTGEVTQPC